MPAGGQVWLRKSHHRKKIETIPVAWTPCSKQLEFRPTRFTTRPDSKFQTSAFEQFTVLSERPLAGSALRHALGRCTAGTWTQCLTITSRELGQELQEQRVGLLRNYLHPWKAAERSGALIEQRCAKRRAMPRSVLGAVSKTGGARAIRFGTPEKLCKVLDCQPGDLFAFENPAADVAAVAS